MRQGLGIMAAMERKIINIEEANPEFLVRTLQKFNQRLIGLFNRLLDEQIRAIEDTKVKIKKRKGLISFMKIFPQFSIAVENMLSGTEVNEVRELINGAYGRINKAMFESLKVIAKESPIGMGGAAVGDPEDKEALNYH